MTHAEGERLEARVLVLAPTVGEDAEPTSAVLARAGIACVGCADLVELCEQLTVGAGAVLIAEEAIPGGAGCLVEWLGRQPPWSDLALRRSEVRTRGSTTTWSSPSTPTSWRSCWSG